MDNKFAIENIVDNIISHRYCGVQKHLPWKIMQINFLKENVVDN